MNGTRELEKKESPEFDSWADASDSKPSSCLHDPGVPVPPVINVKDEEQVPNEAGSSQVSIPSENLSGVNGDSLPSTDSDCRASPVSKNWGKTSRQKSRKRKAKLLTPGYAKDWESNDSWTSEKAQEDCTVVAEEIETKRRKIKSLQQKNRRLKVRHSRLKAAIKEMKANMAGRD